MKNMTFKEKFLFIFLQIITLGLIWVYWNKRKKDFSNKNELSFSKKTNFDIDKLLQYLGGIENIKTITHTQKKIKIGYIQRNDIDTNKIRNIKGISGIFINDSFLTIIVGNEAKIITESLLALK